MDFNTTVDLIIKDLYEARDIIDDLKNYPGIPALQIELAKSKCKSAAEVIALLKSAGNTPYDPNEVKSESYIRPEVKKVVAVEKPLPPPKQEVRSQPVSAVKNEQPVTRKKSSSRAIVADSFTNLPGSLNEQLGNLRDEDDISDRIKTKHVTNLSDAIGINDKFLFIREIFGGNTEIFNQAISRLDSAENLFDAKIIMSGYTGDRSDNDASLQLLELVKRKFTSDE